MKEKLNEISYMNTIMAYSSIVQKYYWCEWISWNYSKFVEHNLTAKVNFLKDYLKIPFIVIG